MRVGDVDQRRPVELLLPVQGIDRLRVIGRAAVMPDIGDPAAVLLVNRGLISAARLKIVVADEAHVVRLGWIADLLLIGGCRSRAHRNRAGGGDAEWKTSHGDLSPLISCSSATRR